MIGDEPITAKLTGKNDASKPFADVINQIVSRVNRPMTVKVEYYKADNEQSSGVYSSREDVKIVIRLPLEEASALDIYQEDDLAAKGVRFLNFKGAGVEVEANSNGADVTISGGSGTPIEKVILYVDDDGDIFAKTVTSYDTITGDYTGT